MWMRGIPAARAGITLLSEYMKIWCNIQVIIYQMAVSCVKFIRSFKYDNKDDNIHKSEALRKMKNKRAIALVDCRKLIRRVLICKEKFYSKRTYFYL